MNKKRQAKSTEFSKQITDSLPLNNLSSESHYKQIALNWKRCAEDYANMLVQSHRHLLLKENKLELFANIEANKLLTRFKECEAANVIH